MNKANLVIAAILTAALIAIGTAQTRIQGQLGQAGRYQLVGAPYKWQATVDRKLVVDEQNHLFRIDTVTGETSILAFRMDQNNLQSFWNPIGR